MCQTCAGRLKVLEAIARHGWEIDSHNPYVAKKRATRAGSKP